MTIQELIEELEKIEDKTTKVFVRSRKDIEDVLEVIYEGDGVYLVSF